MFAMVAPYDFCRLNNAEKFHALGEKLTAYNIDRLILDLLPERAGAIVECAQMFEYCIQIY